MPSAWHDVGPNALYALHMPNFWATFVTCLCSDNVSHHLRLVLAKFTSSDFALEYSSIKALLALIQGVYYNFLGWKIDPMIIPRNWGPVVQMYYGVLSGGKWKTEHQPNFLMDFMSWGIQHHVVLFLRTGTYSGIMLQTLISTKRRLILRSFKEESVAP
jgi:hypothetical protein